MTTTGLRKKWPKPTSLRIPLIVTAATIPDRCPDCGNRVLGRTIDGDACCPTCGNVMYISESYEPADRDGLRKAMAV